MVSNPGKIAIVTYLFNIILMRICRRTVCCCHYNYFCILGFYLTRSTLDSPSSYLRLSSVSIMERNRDQLKSLYKIYEIYFVIASSVGYCLLLMASLGWHCIHFVQDRGKLMSMASGGCVFLHYRFVQLDLIFFRLRCFTALSGGKTSTMVYSLAGP